MEIITNTKSFFEDKDKQLLIKQKFRPGLLKFDSDGKYEINRSIDLNIPLDNIYVSPSNKTFSKTIQLEYNSDENLLSVDSKEADILLNKSVNGLFNICFNNNLKSEKKNNNNKKSRYKRYKNINDYYSIIISYNQKEFKLDENIKNEFRNILKTDNEEEQYKELRKLYNKYGIWVPFEFVLGGKYNIFFDAKNEEEKNEIEKSLIYSNNTTINEQKLVGNMKFNDKNEINKKMENLNITYTVIGGDPKKKDNFNEWYDSLNIDNIEIIDYKTKIPLHEYCDDEVKKVVEKLLEKEEKSLEEIEKENLIEQENEINEKNNTFQMNSSVQEEEDYNHSITITFLGDNDSGKTSIIRRIKFGTFNVNKKYISGYDCNSKIIKLKEGEKNIKIKVQMQEYPVDHSNLSYLQQTDCIVLVFDVNNRTAINNLENWYESIKKFNKKQVDVFLLPNKVDPENQISDEEVKKICQKYEWKRLKNINCQTLISDNLDKNFKTLTYIAYTRYKNRISKIEKTDNKPKKKECWQF